MTSTRRMTSRTVTAVAVSLATAWQAGVVEAQVRVIIEGGEIEILGNGQIEVLGNGQVAEPREQPQLDRDQRQGPLARLPVGPLAETATAAIGDPWWDAAAEKPTAAGGAAGADQPIGHNVLMRNMARQRIEMQRRGQALDHLRRELSLLRGACPELTPHARAEIVAAGRAAVEREVQAGTPAGTRATRGVEAVVEQMVAIQAGPADLAAYRRELVARDRRRRDAGVAVLTEAVDQEALLNPRQRQEVAAALADNWQPAWDQVLLLATRQRVSGSGLPAGVEDVVAEVLDAESFAFWRERLGPVTP